MIGTIAMPLQAFWQDCTNGSPAKFLSAGNIPRRRSALASLHLWIPLVRSRTLPPDHRVTGTLLIPR